MKVNKNIDSRYPVNIPKQTCAIFVYIDDQDNLIEKLDILMMMISIANGNTQLRRPSFDG